MDYLNRDSFYTGVSEGVIGGDRIIKMLELVDDKLVVEEKAIYSIEKFIVARRLMYWQVYLHKTVVACELMLVETLRRANELALGGTAVFGSPALLRFLGAQHDRNSFKDPAVLNDFLKLDDHDVMGAVKVWSDHPDTTLSTLASDLVERRNLRIRLQEEPWDPARIADLKKRVAAHLKIDIAEAGRFVLHGSIVNNAYDAGYDRIELLYKDGSVRDIAEASDNLGIQALSKPVEKWYLAWPRCVGGVRGMARRFRQYQAEMNHMDTFGEILWYLMFLTPIVTLPLVWKYSSGPKWLRVMLGSLIALLLSLLTLSHQLDHPVP